MRFRAVSSVCCRALVRIGRISDRPTVSHSAFRHVLYSNLGVLEVEEILRWILDAPKDDEADIDDILTAREHRTLCPHIGRTTTKCTNTDFKDILACNLRQIHLVDRIRQTVVQAGRFLAYRVTKTQHYAEFIWV
jgi:hypothetical protein